MSLAIASSQRQLQHVANGTMMGIHDIFPKNNDDDNDPISTKKMKKDEARFSTTNTLLGFDFDGCDKTIWLEEGKRAALLLILKKWIRTGTSTHLGIPYKEFESVTAKIRHAFTAIPAGIGLLSPCNTVLAAKPTRVLLHRNKVLLTAIADIRTLLKESIAAPTRCRELTSGWPDYIGYTDVSGSGFGGIIIGELRAVPPTVFRGEWPPDVRNSLRTASNPGGSLSISDMEMAGLLLTWFVMEARCPKLCEANIALLSDNSPSVSWVDRLASKRSTVGMALIRALALCLKTHHCSPLTPLHIAGK